MKRDEGGSKILQCTNGFIKETAYTRNCQALGKLLLRSLQPPHQQAGAEHMNHQGQ